MQFSIHPLTGDHLRACSAFARCLLSALIRQGHHVQSVSAIRLTASLVAS